tara:strand:+ start:146 stop:313 length:168 start_codon:yes stop_codon:yes gene_type:complete
MACSKCNKGKKINRTSSRINQKSKVTIPKKTCTKITKRNNVVTAKREEKITLRRR